MYGGPRYLSFERDAGTIAALDGLRAAAILLVLARHAIVPFREIGQPFWPVFGWDAATPLVNGWIGVDLFFVLSGFLISRGLIRRAGAPGGVRLLRYFGRRFLRIVPAYYAMLAIVCAGAVPFYAVAPDLLGLRIGYHLLFLQDYLPASIVVAFWSLGVEEKFYIVAPFVLVPLLRLRSRRWQYALIAGLVLTPLAFRLNILGGGASVPDYEAFFRTLRSPFHRGFDGLAAGALAALLWRDRQRIQWLTDPRVAGALFWAGAAIVGWLWLKTPLLDVIGAFDRTLLQLVLAIGFAAILLGALGGGGPQRIMGSVRLTPVAKLSYSLYLVHMTVIPGAIMASQHLNAAFDGPFGSDFYLFAPIYVVLSAAGALSLHFIVEKPFLRLRESSGRSRPPAPFRQSVGPIATNGAYTGKPRRAT